MNNYGWDGISARKTHVVRTCTQLAYSYERKRSHFVAWFFKKKKTGTRGNNIVRCCLLYFYYFQVSFFRSFWRFFFAKMYAPGPNGDCIVSPKQPPTQNEVVVFMHAYIVKNRAGMIQHSPRYVHTSEYNQSTPTTKTVVRVYSCVTLFYT